MADTKLTSASLMARSVLRSDVRRGIATLRPEVFERIPFQPAPAPQPPAPPPAPAPPAPVPLAAPPVEAVPLAPAESPFDKLPFPSPGDRIKADDFKALSQSVRMLYDLFVLSSTLFGLPYGDVRLMLASRGYRISRVITVFGNEITNLADTSLDARKVLQAAPAEPGRPEVTLVLSEATDTRRFMPNLQNMSYRTAQSYIQTLLGDVALQGAPPTAPQLTGMDLSNAASTIPR
jgi:hypothetical protein